MEKKINFTRIDGRTVISDEGVEVTIAGPCAIRYAVGKRSIRFRMEHTFACDFLLTFMVYLPEKLTWSETGESLTPEEIEAIRPNITQGIALGDAMTVFIAPKSLEKSPTPAAKEDQGNVH